MPDQKCLDCLDFAVSGYSRCGPRKCALPYEWGIVHWTLDADRCSNVLKKCQNKPNPGAALCEECTSGSVLSLYKSQTLITIQAKGLISQLLLLMPRLNRNRNSYFGLLGNQLPLGDGNRKEEWPLCTTLLSTCTSSFVLLRLRTSCLLD